MTTPNSQQDQMRSLLEELEQIAKTTRKDSFSETESRVVKTITMSGHVLDLVKSIVSESEYATLEKKFFLSVKHRNASKFTNSFKQVKKTTT